MTALFVKIGRSTRIRTLDPLVPNQVRYRTAPHSEDEIITRLSIHVNVDGGSRSVAYLVSNTTRASFRHLRSFGFDHDTNQRLGT